MNEWHTFEDNGIDRERLYEFNYGTKELKLLRESTLQKKLPPITFSYVTDIKTKEKYKTMDYWDYTYSGTNMGELFICGNSSF